MREIPLTKGYVALVDDEDFERVNKFYWHANMGAKTPRAVARIDGKLVYMHRLITDAPEHTEVDHWNHDSLDNRRANLRLATKSQNMGNLRKRENSSAPFKGIKFIAHLKSRPWRAWGSVNKCRVHLGYHASAEEAAVAYDRWATKAFGEFAYLNFKETA